MFRRVIVMAGVALAVIGLTASAASAFECYNANRSEQGNASAAKSQALMSFEEILTNPDIVGLCPAGAEMVIEAAAAEGFRTDVLINFHTLMASGLERTGKEDKLHDGQGIDHLSEEFFAFVEPLIEEAFGLCAGG